MLVPGLDPLDCNPQPNLPAAVDLQTLLGVLGYDAAKVPPREQREQVDNTLEAQSYIAVLEQLKGPEMDFEDLGKALVLDGLAKTYKKHPLIANLVPSVQESLEIHFANESFSFRHVLANDLSADILLSPQEIVLATFHYRLAEFTQSEYPEVFDTREVPDEVSRMHREGEAYIRQEFVYRDVANGFHKGIGNDFQMPFYDDGDGGDVVDRWDDDPNSTGPSRGYFPWGDL